MCASTRGRLDCMRLLVQCGAGLETKNNVWQTRRLCLPWNFCLDVVLLIHQKLLGWLSFAGIRLALYYFPSHTRCYHFGWVVTPFIYQNQAVGIDGADVCHRTEMHQGGSHRLHAFADWRRRWYKDHGQGAWHDVIYVFRWACSNLFRSCPQSEPKDSKCTISLIKVSHVTIHITMFFSNHVCSQKGMNALDHARKRGLPVIVALLSKAWGIVLRLCLHW